MITQTKFIAAFIRRNVDGKADYIGFYQHTNGRPVFFTTQAEALEKAASICSDKSSASYGPQAIPAN